MSYRFLHFFAVYEHAQSNCSLSRNTIFIRRIDYFISRRKNDESEDKIIEILLFL